MLGMITTGALKHLARGYIMHSNIWARVLVVRVSVLFVKAAGATEGDKVLARRRIMDMHEVACFLVVAFAVTHRSCGAMEWRASL